MVEKLIRGKIIEITIVILLVLASIPIWKNFEEKISTASVTTLDDYNVSFDVSSSNEIDKIVVNNDYYINKNYKIMLVTDKKINTESSKLLINNKEYFISDFYRENKKGNYIYTLVDGYIIANSISYEIKPELLGDKISYTYIFEEKTVF